VDLSYLSIADAVPQLERLCIHTDADLVALVKPTFELSRPTLAAASIDVSDATRRATSAIEHAAWTVQSSCWALPTGQRGALEVFIHAKRRRI
jgi:predicted rRNA methylase YqxC with S4 and FtsJ domains